MTPDPERERTERDDARFTARLRDAFAPEPLSPVQRAAFDARLQERLERSRSRLGLWPALGGGLLATALAALLLARGTLSPPAPPIAATTPAETTTAWAADLLYPSDDDESAADEQALPAEYAAIADAFLDR